MAAVTLFLLENNRRTEHNTHFCMPLKPVFTRDCGDGLHFMDEPTIGLDAVASKQIRKFLKEINEQRGTTIILTSHYMEDIKALCKRTVVINHGSKIYDGTTDELFDRYQKNKKVIVTFEEPAGEIELRTQNVSLVEDAPYKKVYEVSKQCVKALFSELMKYEPKDIVVEDEEIGVVVERIYHEGGLS